jgi:hypothetical protein
MLGERTLIYFFFGDKSINAGYLAKWGEVGGKNVSEGTILRLKEGDYLKVATVHVSPTSPSPLTFFGTRLADLGYHRSLQAHEVQEAGEAHAKPEECLLLYTYALWTAAGQEKVFVSDRAG